MFFLTRMHSKEGSRYYRSLYVIYLKRRKSSNLLSTALTRSLYFSWGLWYKNKPKSKAHVTRKFGCCSLLTETSERDTQKRLFKSELTQQKSTGKGGTTEQDSTPGNLVLLPIQWVLITVVRFCPDVHNEWAEVSLFSITVVEKLLQAFKHSKE